jgi:hypothetical protein
VVVIEGLRRFWTECHATGQPWDDSDFLIGACSIVLMFIIYVPGYSPLEACHYLQASALERQEQNQKCRFRAEPMSFLIPA